jgi:hypothetical protein
MSHDALAMLDRGLPQAVARLRDLAWGDDRKAAASAVGMLLGYLGSEAAMRRTAALGPAAAEMHQAALEAVLTRQVELEAAARH